MIRLTKAEFDGLMQIRESGHTNMFDLGAVQFWADQFGHHDLVDRLQDTDKADYGRFIMNGQYELIEE